MLKLHCISLLLGLFTPAIWCLSVLAAIMQFSIMGGLNRDLVPKVRSISQFVSPVRDIFMACTQLSSCCYLYVAGREHGLSRLSLPIRTLVSWGGPPSQHHPKLITSYRPFFPTPCGSGLQHINGGECTHSELDTGLIIFPKSLCNPWLVNTTSYSACFQWLDIHLYKFISEFAKYLTYNYRVS